MSKNRMDFTVATLAELATVHVAQLVDGTNAWVISELDYWTLNKTGTLPIGPDVIAPLAGSPSAGAATALWERQAGGAPGAGPSNVVYRQGAVNPEAPVYGSFADALEAATTSGAEASILIDPSLGQPVVPAGTYALPPGLTIAGILGNAATLQILDGASFTGTGLRVRGGLTLAPTNNTNQIINVPDTAPFTLVLDEGSGVVMSAGSTNAFLQAQTGATVNVLMDQNSAVVGVAAAAVFNAGPAPAGYQVTVGEGVSIGTNVFGGAGAVTLQQTSPGASIAALANNVVQTPVGTGGIFAGTTPALVLGTTTVSLPGLRATSKIVVTLRQYVPGAGSLTVHYAVNGTAAPSGRTPGAAGSFIINALVAAGTVNTLDLSILDWIVVL